MEEVSSLCEICDRREGCPMLTGPSFWYGSGGLQYCNICGKMIDAKGQVVAIPSGYMMTCSTGEKIGSDREVLNEPS